MKASIVASLILGAATATAASNYTISTVYTTNIYTITSCAPTVTDCPAKMGSVTTEVVSLYTTICPVTATESKSEAKPTSTIAYTSCDSSSSASKSEISKAPEMTTSTIKVTKEYTITSCPATVTDCPVGKKTSTVYDTTTICPVTETETKSAPAETHPAASSSAPAETHPAPAKDTAAASSAPVVSQISDGQIQATAATSSGSAASSAPAKGSAAASSAPVVSQISDGQIQVTAAASSAPIAASSVPVVSQISDGQIQATAAASKPAAQTTVVPLTTIVTKPNAASTATSTIARNATATVVPFTGAAVAQKTGGLLVALGFVFAAFL